MTYARHAAVEWALSTELRPPNRRPWTTWRRRK